MASSENVFNKDVIIITLFIANVQFKKNKELFKLK